MFRSLIRPINRSLTQSIKPSIQQSLQQSIRWFSNSSKGPSHWILTTSGADEPGIVAKLSNVLHSDLNANIEESRMAKLGSAFSVMLHVSIEPSENQSINEQVLTDKVKSLFPQFIVAAHRTEAYPEQASEQSENQSIDYTIICEGPDQKGVVSSLTQALTKLNANVSIKDLSTDVHAAPFAGYQIFSVQLVIECPQSVEQSSIQAVLDQFSDKTGFDCWMDRTDAQDEEEEQGFGKDE